MATDSKTLDFIIKLGEAAPPPIRLSKVFQSPAQDFFSFQTSAQNAKILPVIFERVGRSLINIRYVSQFVTRPGWCNTQFCIDLNYRKVALEIFAAREVSEEVHCFRHVAGATILSLYPFQGQPQLAERAFSSLQQIGIEILGANCGTSVFSFVIAGSALDSAMKGLKGVFLIGE